MLFMCDLSLSLVSSKMALCVLKVMILTHFLFDGSVAVRNSNLMSQNKF